MNNEEIIQNYVRVNLYNRINLAFLNCPMDTACDVKPRGTILLIHGFPETSYQWRAVIPTLTAQGYRVLAPDYRGAGESSKPSEGYTKASMAADLVMLLDEQGVDEKVHVVGHDIGGTIAFMLASRWPDRVASLCVSECLLPGTETFREEHRKHPNEYFHHEFHCIENLPEALIGGREKTYIEYFINKLCYRIGAFSPDVVQRYANSYSQVGALRCALDLYRAFDKDADDLDAWLEQHGKSTVPTLVLYGENSSYSEFMMKMLFEVAEERCICEGRVEQAAHFLPEENPRGFAETLLRFVNRKHN